MPNLLTRIAPYAQWRLVQWLAGAGFAFAFAPYFFLPAFVLGMLIYYHGQRTAPSARAAAVRSFWFGYGFSIAGTYWIAFSLLVDADAFGWLIPFSVLGLSAAMAIWWALQGYVYARVRARHPLHDVVLFASAITLIEYAKSFGIFGFPWNLNGYAFLEILPFAQIASVVGVYGLGWIAVCAVVCLYYVRVQPRAAMAAAASVLLLTAWGYQRMQAPLQETTTQVRLVQPNIAQSMKWNQDAARDTLAVLGTLSKQGGTSTPDIVIWPETALPYTITQRTDWPTLMQNLVPKGAALITGAVREDAGGGLYNSILFVRGGDVVATYDKHQLVPFGEFVPLRRLLPLDKITPGAQDFSKGTGAMRINMDKNLPSMSPLVCYEAAFSHLAVAKGLRPSLLVNLTNDAWFGDSPGPYQHMAMAQMRAIEQGLPLIRVANTGVSAMVSPYGERQAYLPLAATGVIDHHVVASIPSPFYTRYGSVWAVIVIVVLLHGLITTIRRKG